MARYVIQMESGWAQEFETPEAVGSALVNTPTRGPVSTRVIEDDGTERPFTEQEQERLDMAFRDRLQDGAS